jgi:hypothetical protein
VSATDVSPGPRSAAVDHSETARGRGPWDALAPWLPAAAVATVMVGLLGAANTPLWDICRYGAYVAYAVIVPGTLVYRALRRTPHTLIEDLAYGAVTGLVLEIAAWAVWSSVGARAWLWAWPLVVIAVFAAVPSLRRHWWVRDYRPTPAGFAWATAAICGGFLGYLYVTFLHPNPILPAGERQRIYVDLPYQLSLAAEAKHHFPPHVPQVAEEPLHYHYFAFAHQGAGSLISGVDLTSVVLRLDVPLLCLAAIVALAVTGWRVSGRPWVGVIAAGLTFTIGEFGFSDPVTMPFGTIATFIVWSSQSMTYSWLLLIVLVGVLADRMGRPPPAEPESPTATGAAAVPGLGPGAWVLLALLALASVGSKATSVPVAAGALAFLAAVQLLRRRRVSRPVLIALAITIGAQLVGNAVLFAFETHGMAVRPFWGPDKFLPPGGGALAVGGIALAFVANMMLRLAGLPVLVWLGGRGRKIGDVEVLLAGGALTGVVAYLVFAHPGDANQYFLRAGWMFGVIGSAWGAVLLADRARLTGRAPAAARARRSLAAAAVLCCAILIGLELAFAGPVTGRDRFAPLDPIVSWFLALFAITAIGAFLWQIARALTPTLRGRGPVVLLTLALLAGAPGLVMESRIAHRHPNGGGYAPVVMPASRVEAARWLREHSTPAQVVATNAHCLAVVRGLCDSRTFWISAYSERRVLVEGWIFAPRAAAMAATSPSGVYTPFWDQGLLRLNDAAFTAPTPEVLLALRDEHGVRWLVADRTSAAGRESPALARYADKVFDNGRIAIYALR